MAAVHRDQNYIHTLLAEATGKGVVVLGAGVTGQQTARQFAAAGCRVTILDEAETPAVEVDLLQSGLVNVEASFNPLKTNAETAEWRDAALAVSSPGINPERPIVAGVRDMGIPVLSELDVACAVCGMPEAAVTGTNGKTTVVTLIDEMCRRSGVPAAAAGNVGAPVIGFCNLAKREAWRPRKLICEVSSYQLAHAGHFAPHAAVLLNVADDHLGWHGGFDSYLEAKKKIFLQQEAGDWSLVWADDPCRERICSGLPGSVIFFGIGGEPSRGREGCWAIPSSKEIVVSIGSKKARLSTSKTAFSRTHNMINLAAAAGTALLAGASEQGMQDAIDTVQPLPHRLEQVAVAGGVTYVNDSKATNVAAVCAALESLADEGRAGRVLLLLGGLSKDGSWKPLTPFIQDTCRKVFAFGADRTQIVDGLCGLEVECCEDMEEAVAEARKSAEPDDIVLLSPGCASFDAFANYGARGDRFREMCRSFD